jgi:general secretion pathway protein G
MKSEENQMLVRVRSRRLFWSLERNSIAKRSGQTVDDGFTLVELLVVLAIIGLLAAIVAPKVLNYLATARVESAKVQIRNIESALELYYLDTGKYPSKDEGLTALAEAPASSQNWNGPYMKRADSLKDPWGNSYVYSEPTKLEPTPLVRSFGRDGKEGGEDLDGDLP